MPPFPRIHPFLLPSAASPPFIPPALPFVAGIAARARPSNPPCLSTLLRPHLLFHCSAAPWRGSFLWCVNLVIWRAREGGGELRQKGSALAPFRPPAMWRRRRQRLSGDPCRPAHSSRALQPAQGAAGGCKRPSVTPPGANGLPRRLARRQARSGRCAGLRQHVEGWRGRRHPLAGAAALGQVCVARTAACRACTGLEIDAASVLKRWRRLASLLVAAAAAAAALPSAPAAPPGPAAKRA